MRIERHRVGEGAVAAARENFADRIGTLARSMSKAGWMTTYEWWELAEEFLDYLGALSVSTPDLYTPEARAVLDNATEAAAGAVAYAAYHPHVSFHIFLDYLNFGMSYEPGSGAPVESVTADLWLDAFCLAILSDRAERHGEAFHFARRKFPPLAAGQPAVELAGGFMAYVIGTPGTTTPAIRRPGRKNSPRSTPRSPGSGTGTTGPPPSCTIRARSRSRPCGP